MMKLIINADDFGLSRAANYGIIDAHRNGVVRSTSIMAGMPAFDHAVEILKSYPDLGCGVHMTLSSYKPLLKTHKTLVDENGYFYSTTKPDSNLDNFNLEEVFDELCAQIEKVKDAGIEITHLDSHHHIHTALSLKPVILKILDKYDLPIRGGFQYECNYNKIVPFVEFFYQEGVSIETFVNNEEKIKNYTVVDLMSHPGYVDNFMMKTSSYNIKRIEEVEILTSPKLKNFLDESGIELVNYRNLF